MIHSSQQLQAIDHPHNLLKAWRDTKTTPSPKTHAIPKATRPDVNSPPQDATVDKPSRPKWYQKYPRVTATSHTSPHNVDDVQYKFSSPKGPSHPYPRVSLPIDNITLYHNDHTPIVHNYEPIKSYTRYRQILATAVTAASVSSSRYPSEFILNCAMPILDEELVKSLEWRQLRNQQRLKKVRK